MMKYIEIDPFSAKEGRFFLEKDIVSENFSGRTDGAKDSLVLILCLEGCLGGECLVCGHSFQVLAGHSLLFSSPMNALRVEGKGNEDSTSILMNITPRLFTCCSDGREPSLPRSLTDGASVGDGLHHVHPLALSPLMKVIGHQILECALATPVREIFLKSKALELLACCLTVLEEDPRQGRDCPCRLRDGERERIRQARNILVSDLENPPSLEQLAARVGLNSTKLKRGFRHLFGTSVFDYFRHYRLEAARRFLEKDEMSVTEAAMTVGYSNIGHFCAAFKKQFGVNPGHWLRKVFPLLPTTCGHDRARHGRIDGDTVNLFGKRALRPGEYSRPKNRCKLCAIGISGRNRQFAVCFIVDFVKEARNE